MQKTKDLVKTTRGSASLHERLKAAEKSYAEIKLAHRQQSFWYPYPTLYNLRVLEQLIEPSGLDLLQMCRGKHGRIADIGSADGDLAFFLESFGLTVDIFDYGPANFNRLEGARILKQALNSSVSIHELDLDSQFAAMSRTYDVIFFLGILYHLKNPIFVLERLAHLTKYCFLSTRIARQTSDGNLLSRYPLAYLLDANECNNDPTNYWIFSETGLKRLFARTGWSLTSYLTLGSEASTPADPDKDERAFCLLQSKHQV